MEEEKIALRLQKPGSDEQCPLLGGSTWNLLNVQFIVLMHCILTYPKIPQSFLTSCKGQGDNLSRTSCLVHLMGRIYRPFYCHTAMPVPSLCPLRLVWNVMSPLGDSNINIRMVCIPIGMGYTLVLLAEWRERDSWRKKWSRKALKSVLLKQFCASLFNNLKYIKCFCQLNLPCSTSAPSPHSPVLSLGIKSVLQWLWRYSHDFNHHPLIAHLWLTLGRLLIEHAWTWFLELKWTLLCLFLILLVLLEEFWYFMVLVPTVPHLCLSLCQNVFGTLLLIGVQPQGYSWIRHDDIYSDWLFS